MIRIAFLFFILGGGSLAAETVIAVRTIRPQTIITANDIQMSSTVVQGAADHQDLVIGMEARVALYAGRPIHPGDVGPPAIIERNQIVELIFQSGGLLIRTDGRALDRAGIGDRVRVMNISSRTIVVARIAEDGLAYVSN